MRPAPFVLTCLLLLLLLPLAPAFAQSCVSDCACPVGQICSPTNGGGGSCRIGICPTDFDPVCGIDGKTYSNACRARTAHAAIAHQGSCEEGPSTGERPRVHDHDCGCCHPTLIAANGEVVWTEDPDLDSANVQRIDPGTYDLPWEVDISKDGFFVQPIAPTDDFPSSLLGWPARVDDMLLRVMIDTHGIDGSGNHTHRTRRDVEFSLLRCPHRE